MKDKQTELPLNVKFSPPTYNQVQLEAQKIGLPQDEAELFYAHFQSNGWKVGRVQMKSWTDALNVWRIRWKKSTAGQVKSVWEMHRIIEAKQKIADGLKRKYSFETANGRKWQDDGKRREYADLLLELNEMTRQLAGM